MTKRAGEKATPLEGEEAARWRQVQASIGGLARLAVEGAPVEVLQATLEDVRGVELDQKRVFHGTRARGMTPVVEMPWSIDTPIW